MKSNFPIDCVFRFKEGVFTQQNVNPSAYSDGFVAESVNKSTVSTNSMNMAVNRSKPNPLIGAKPVLKRVHPNASANQLIHGNCDRIIPPSINRQKNPTCSQSKNAVQNSAVMDNSKDKAFVLIKTQNSLKNTFQVGSTDSMFYIFKLISNIF